MDPHFGPGPRRHVIINFHINYFIISIFIRENYFYFFMFRDVPACSGMFHVPGFIDAHNYWPAGIGVGIYDFV